MTTLFLYEGGVEGTHGKLIWLMLARWILRIGWLDECTFLIFLFVFPWVELWKVIVKHYCILGDAHVKFLWAMFCVHIKSLHHVGELTRTLRTTGGRILLGSRFITWRSGMEALLKLVTKLHMRCCLESLCTPGMTSIKQWNGGKEQDSNRQWGLRCQVNIW